MPASYWLCVIRSLCLCRHLEQCRVQRHERQNLLVVARTVDPRIALALRITPGEERILQEAQVVFAWRPAIRVDQDVQRRQLGTARMQHTQGLLDPMRVCERQCGREVSRLAMSCFVAGFRHLIDLCTDACGAPPSGNCLPAWLPSRRTKRDDACVIACCRSTPWFSFANKKSDHTPEQPAGTCRKSIRPRYSNPATPRVLAVSRTCSLPKRASIPPEPHLFTSHHCLLALLHF